MFDNENLEQVQETQVEAQPTPQPQIEEKIEVKPAEDHKNFRALKEKAERAERERDELLRKFQQIEAQKEPEDYNIDLGDQDIAEGKHLKKLTKKIKQLEDTNRQYQEQMVQIAAETKIRSAHPDFDAVVSVNNLERLKEEHPELAMALNSSTDLYSKASGAYKMIKSLGIYKEPVDNLEKLRLMENSSKPRSLASVAPQQGDNPLTKANAFAAGLTDDLKTQLRKEMIAAMKNY